MSSFNLFHLPLRPLLKTIKMMSITDLLHLSYKTKHIQSFLRNIPISSGGYLLSLREEGVAIKMCSQKFEYQRAHHDKDQLVDMLMRLFNHLETVFPGGLKFLDILDPISYFEQLEKLPKECDILSIGSPCSEDILDCILNRFDFQTGLILNGRKELKTDNMKVFSVDYLRIDNSKWITETDLLLLKNKFVFLIDSKFWDEDINAFLMKLKRNKRNRLISMTIHRRQRWNPKKILNGFDTFSIEKQVIELEENSNIRLFVPFGNGNQFSLHNFQCFDADNGKRISVGFESSCVRIFVTEQ